MYDDLKDPLENPQPDQGDDEALDAFAANIAASMKRGERVDYTFERRVMSAVLASQFASHSTGALRAAPRQNSRVPSRRSVWSGITRVAVATTLAAAAVMLLVIIGDSTREQSTAPQQTATRAAGLVSFSLYAPGARNVTIVGAFNSWEKGATTLARTSDAGVWSVSLPLAPGRHEYAFIVSDAQGERWVPDPSAVTLRDEFGTESSIRLIGERVAVGAAGS